MRYKIVWMDGKVAKAREGVAFEFISGSKPLLVKFYLREGDEPYIIGTNYLVAIEPVDTRNANSVRGNGGE